MLGAALPEPIAPTIVVGGTPHSPLMFGPIEYECKNGLCVGSVAKALARRCKSLSGSSSYALRLIVEEREGVCEWKEVTRSESPSSSSSGCESQHGKQGRRKIHEREVARTAMRTSEPRTTRKMNGAERVNGWTVLSAPEAEAGAVMDAEADVVEGEENNEPVAVVVTVAAGGV